MLIHPDGGTHNVGEAAMARGAVAVPVVVGSADASSKAHVYSVTIEALREQLLTHLLGVALVLIHSYHGS